MPTRKTVSDIKANLLQPALTSHFEISLTSPGGNFRTYLSENGVIFNQEKLNLMCSETVLPGSNLATHEINNDFTGVTERHVYRRLYDDRIDLTFYVDAVNYMPIRYFESWIKFIVNESITEGSNKAPGSKQPNFFYRVRYPEEYRGSLSVTKFEKDYNSSLTYDFIQAFPIAITSIPVSYDSSSLLKCTVSFSYIRYIVNPRGSGAIRAEEDAASVGNSSQTQNFNLSSQQLAAINSQAFNPNANLGLDYGKYATTGGVPFNASAASGNGISVQDAYSGKFNLNV